jgi:hypothetical protein
MGMPRRFRVIDNDHFLDGLAGPGVDLAGTTAALPEIEGGIGRQIETEQTTSTLHDRQYFVEGLGLPLSACS